jgi:hypothetical protein
VQLYEQIRKAHDREGVSAPGHLGHLDHAASGADVNAPPGPGTPPSSSWSYLAVFKCDVRNPPPH